MVLPKMGSAAAITLLMFVTFCSAGVPTPVLRNETVIFSPSEDCSRTCESSRCFFPPALRYGKYCGIGYTGCDGEAPCDGLDACCKTHDKCIGDDLCNYLNVDCNQHLIDCLTAFADSGAPQFKGASCSTSELVHTINSVIEIGVEAGQALNISGKC